MKLDDLIPNKYIRVARIYPFLITAFPIGIAVFVWLPNEFEIWKSALGSTGLWIVAATLIAQFVRDAGSKKQKNLFKIWGGAPTTKLLRHRDSPNPVILERLHKKLERLLSENSDTFRLPTKEEEINDPKAADHKYEACISYLRNKTRDTDKFNLLFIENYSYGFRRNLWGMKGLSILIAIISTASIAYKLWLDYFVSNSISIINAILFTISFLSLVLWIFLINSSWVKEAADRYAQTLIDSCDLLIPNDHAS